MTSVYSFDIDLLLSAPALSTYGRVGADQGIHNPKVDSSILSSATNPFPAANPSAITPNHLNPDALLPHVACPPKIIARE